MRSLRIQLFKSFTLAALLVAGTAFTACSGEDDIVEQIENPTESKTYTLTIQATKGAATRALSLSGKTLTATWKTGETVDVYKVTDDNGVDEYTSVGTLSAQADGETATLSGNLTGTFAKNDILALFFNGGVLDYGGQTGTLENIASKYDYATAIAEVSAVADGSIITVVDAGTKDEIIPFDNEQTIVKFTLKDKATGEPISMKSLRLHDDNDNIFRITDFTHSGSAHMGDITVTRSTAGSEFFVAIKTEEDYVEPNLVPSSLNLTLTAIGEDNDIYSFNNSDVQFECGKYYEITVKMTRQTENVVSLTWIGSHSYNYSHSYTAQTGDVLTGVATDHNDLDDDTNDTSADIEIKIKDGAIVTLRNMTLDGSLYNSSHRAGINCEGDATIILEGTNAVTGFDSGYPGISVPEGKTLTIQGDGSLTVRSNGAAAGIGASGAACGNIVINSGTITAYGYNNNYEISTWGAGIGGCRANCGDITINGGTVTACGGWGGAGIGSGYGSACGNITINGGSVTATGGGNSAGIGGGFWGGCGNITIAKTITSVSATKGNNTTNANEYTDAFSIGIGGDYTNSLDLMNCTCGTITFDTQSFTAEGHLGDAEHDNSWTYSPEPVSGTTYGGLTFTVTDDTWTLEPANG